MVEVLSTGNPSSMAGGYGVRKRIAALAEHFQLKGAVVLDAGCGDGCYSHELEARGARVFGVDQMRDFLIRARSTGLPVARGDLERLPFADSTFDMVFTNEVIEHTPDDAAALAEFFRVTREGGMVVIYAPNRYFPMETHGFSLGKHNFRFIPLFNYLPGFVRDRLYKKARCYTTGSLTGLVRTSSKGVRVRRTGYVYPSLDGLSRKAGALASVLRKVIKVLEMTPLRVFGISVFVVAEKLPHARAAR